MAHFALFFDPEFAFAKARVVHADMHHQGPEQHSFWREEREIYRVPARYLARVERFETAADAEDCVRQALSRHGSATVHIEERGATAARRRSREATGGGVLESVRIVVKE